ncbi:hypothetical protein, partial [Priestia megaterium]|nr:hypothetical protein [Priestia megaterium]
MTLAIKVALAIIKYGSKALNLIKGAVGALWNSFIAAKNAGYMALAKWLFNHASILSAIYKILKHYGL